MLERKQSASLQLREGKKPRGNNANDSFGKGFRMLKDHSATLKGLKSSPRMYADVSSTLKTAPSPEWKSDTQTDRDRQSDYCNPLVHAR